MSIIQNMAIIQKMLLILLAITLLPIMIIGSIFYLSVQSSQRQQILSHIETIATIQQSRVEALITQNRATLDAFTNNLPLEIVLTRYDRMHDNPDALLLQQSVLQTQTLTKGFTAVSLMDPTGKVVASSRANTVGQSYASPALFQQGLRGDDVTSNVFRDAQGKAAIDFVGPLKLADNVLGVVVIEYDASSLWAVSKDETGLGSTGEIMLTEKDAQGSPRYLTPLRFDSSLSLRPVIGTSMQSLVMHALAKDEATYIDVVDYRNQAVLAVTRYIPDAHWGLVVKMDQTEAYQAVRQLGDLLIVTIFIISVLIIFLAFYLARRLNEPILMLVSTADKIRAGDLSQRAPVMSMDEIGQLATAFNAMADELEKIDQMKSEFVLLTSHQLRTPATAVKGFIAMLLDNYAGPISSKQKELAKAAYAENERQISVINSILDVARLEAGDLTLTKGTHDIRTIIDASAAGQAPLAAAQSQKLEIKKLKHPVELMVDAQKLQLVIDNLIHNAIKYSPRDTAITVSIENLPKHVLIHVKDQGIGIATKDLPRLFRRFSRIAGPQTAKVQGAGLGLYLADKLVTMHGGKISVVSHPGKGTTFTIDLPNIPNEEAKDGTHTNS